MSFLHLATGSEMPPNVEGKVRLYSMEYCPYVHRVRLVLAAKKIPHDIVNINLVNKPQWFMDIQPEGKVPVLDTGDKLITESVDIADFLEEKFSQPSLYASEPNSRALDKQIIDKCDQLVNEFLAKSLGPVKKPTGHECLNIFLPYFEEFESELKRRHTVFFGGDKPGIVDYMLWPWAERIRAVGMIIEDNFPLEPDHVPLLCAWKTAMKNDPIARSLYCSAEKFYKAVQIKLGHIPPEFDNL